MIMQISYATIQEIEFIKPKVPEQTPMARSDSISVNKCRLIPPSAVKMEIFCSTCNLKVENPKAVVLSIIPGYSKSFILVSHTSRFPVSLSTSTFYKPKYLNLSY